MKLRIQGNSLRLRLTQPEVQRISRQEAVQEKMYIGINQPALIYTLAVHASDDPTTLTFQNYEIKVSLPVSEALPWATSDQVGIEHRLPVVDDQTLHVLIEKDFQCLHRDEQEEPDQFPNPAASEE